MPLAKCYACTRVVMCEAKECSHCGASFRRRKGAYVQTLCLLAIACALAFPIVNNLYAH